MLSAWKPDVLSSWFLMEGNECKLVQKTSGRRSRPWVKENQDVPGLWTLKRAGQGRAGQGGGAVVSHLAPPVQAKIAASSAAGKLSAAVAHISPTSPSHVKGAASLKILVPSSSKGQVLRTSP